MRLVLGEKAERFTIDDPSGNGTIYLEKWNEGRFGVAAMRLAVQHLLGPDRQKRMLEEIVRRTHEIAPIKAGQLRNERFSIAHSGCPERVHRPDYERGSTRRELPTSCHRAADVTGLCRSRKMKLFCYPLGHD